MKTFNINQFSSLLKLTKIFETEVTIDKDIKLNTSKGVIFSYEAQYSNQNDLLEQLKDQKVIEITRFIRKNGIPTNMYFVTSISPPKNIFIGYENCSVERYIPNPRRCFKCLKFNHSKEKCRNEISKCFICGDDRDLKHESELDTITKKCLRVIKCVNCNGDHSSLSKNCPVFIKEKEILLIKTEENISFIDARKKFYQINPIQKGPSFSKIIKKANCKCPCNCKSKHIIESNINPL